MQKGFGGKRPNRDGKGGRGAQTTPNARPTIEDGPIKDGKYGVISIEKMRELGMLQYVVGEVFFKGGLYQNGFPVSYDKYKDPNARPTFGREEREIAPNHDQEVRAESKMCKFDAKGHCKFGLNCKFQHQAGSQPPVSAKKPAGVASIKSPSIAPKVEEDGGSDAFTSGAHVRESWREPKTAVPANDAENIKNVMLRVQKATANLAALSVAELQATLDAKAAASATAKAMAAELEAAQTLEERFSKLVAADIPDDGGDRAATACGADQPHSGRTSDYESDDHSELDYSNGKGENPLSKSDRGIVPQTEDEGLRLRDAVALAKVEDEAEDYFSDARSSTSSSDLPPLEENYAEEGSVPAELGAAAPVLVSERVLPEVPPSAEVERLTSSTVIDLCSMIREMTHDASASEFGSIRVMHGQRMCNDAYYFWVRKGRLIATTKRVRRNFNNVHFGDLGQEAKSSLETATSDMPSWVQDIANNIVRSIKGGSY